MNRISSLLAYVRKLAQPPGAGLLPDADLLRRFVDDRDEAAFELLVRRHGPMVLGVAHRVVRDTHAAEDVFQAAFLTLARKARSVRRRNELAGWLYRVTLRIALRLRQQKSKLQSRESVLTHEPAATATDLLLRGELKTVIDQEVDRLPDRFRLPVVLCYLGGQSTDEAARVLGCPRGTVLSRLATARDRLRTRLTRRGFTLSATGLLTVLAESTTSATVPPVLLSITIRAATAGAAGLATAVSPQVVSLSQGVIHAMFVSKIKITAAVLLGAGMLGAGAGWVRQPVAVADNPVVKSQQEKDTQPVTEKNARDKNEAEIAVLSSIEDTIKHKWAEGAEVMRVEQRRLIVLEETLKAQERRFSRHREMEQSNMQEMC